MPPNHCTGRRPATGASDSAARGIPAQMTAAVPSTGTSAIAPGKSSWSVKVRAATAMAARPIHAARARVRRSRCPGERRQERQQAADPELPRPREGREVGEVVVLAGEDHAVHERGDRGCREHAGDHEHATTAEADAPARAPR